MRPCTCALVLAGLLAAPLSAQKPPKVRIHFWTAQPASGAIVDPDQKDRDDAVKDLKSMIGWKLGSKKTFEIAPKESSHVHVEVLKRGYQDVSGEIRPAKNPALGDQARVILAKLRFGEYSTDLDCRDRSGGGWRMTAGECYEQIQNWVKANRAQFK